MVFNDFQVETSVVKNRETGEVFGNDSTETVLLDVELTYVGEEWRVSREVLDKEFEGVSECPSE